MSHHLAHGNDLARVRTEYLSKVIRAWWQRQMYRIRKANRIRRDHECLLELSDKMLADIGLTRFDIDKGYAQRLRSTFGGHWTHFW
ncbi:MAG: hypothetical protein AAF222_01695 [Pseudomonadota bacterium]